MDDDLMNFLKGMKAEATDMSVQLFKQGEQNRLAIVSVTATVAFNQQAADARLSNLERIVMGAKTGRGGRCERGTNNSRPRSGINDG